MYQRILILIFLLLLHCRFGRGKQRITEGPSDVISRFGETIVFKCRVDDQEGAVQWLKNGFGLGSTRDLPLYKRYSMIGRSSLGEYHLQIENSTFDDEAQYECHIEETATSASQTSAAASLKIISEPEPPKLLTNKTKISLEEGQNIDLTCQAQNGRPASQLAWVILENRDSTKVLHWLGNSSKILKNTNFHGNEEEAPYNVAIRNDNKPLPNGLETSTSRISFPISKLDDQGHIACIALHPTYTTSHKIASLPLDVLYAPNVEIKLDETRSSLEEGGQVVLTCHVEAKPLENLKIYWTKNDKPLEPSGPQTVIVRNIRMEDNEHKVICHAENSVGKGEAIYKLDIHYGPRIMTTSQTKAVQRGEPVTFICEATGNPKPTIYWRHKNSDQLVGQGNKLTLDSVNPSQVGEYECVASVHGFEDARMKNFLHLKGPPIIEFTDSLIEHDKSKVVMTCKVRGKPFPKNIMWIHNGQVINFGATKGRMQAQEKHQEYGMESKLTIFRVTENDYGIYNCSATNEYGSDSMIAELKELTLIEQLVHYGGVNIITLIGAGIIIFLLLIICALCCVKQKCCKNKKSAPFKDDPSDVTVRCEALDGVQFFGADVYSAEGLDNVDLIGSSKDYISVPQNNPDLDYLPPPNVIYQTSPGYAPHPHDYASSDNSIRYDQSYNSFLPHHLGNSHVVDLYGNSYLKHSNNGGQLETLAEVATPDTESGTPLLVPGESHDRTVSQMSTHV
uniref:Ig-like domain-containing protein n=1 Tax=Panagrolaimus sp. PS1159 TaxID=55785 RepID=A0AC35G811_9BILA